MRKKSEPQSWRVTIGALPPRSKAQAYMGGGVPPLGDDVIETRQVEAVDSSGRRQSVIVVVRRLRDDE